ncbi:uncharacterized protein LOC106163459 isoform X2 [Lingula anatina]|uniref:Uncharacterized protein LOC106163459 isoform X2 n=1 Tax=Lingula anatina TaxID=7574 RepID=A0A1S3IE20_LINAN|nr:uncharacterized protein LOC106163459 isoform X2 [Lingula anatina]|eukprot:XP_013396505.1 uncharacterized protein LOC106163459 isoform X2 [Lingula anatina]
MEVDLIIRGGRVIDPANNIDDILDVAVKDGKIAALGANLQVESTTSEYDASGLLVTPGLIDLHVHVYEYSTPLGVNPDTSCLARGVTTVVDAGSAGCGTFPGLRKYIAEKSKTRVLAFLHISAHGLAAFGCAAGKSTGGECDAIQHLDVQGCLDTVEQNRDLIVGIKIRLTANVADQGRNEHEAYRRALEVSEKTGLPLMTHHTISTVPLHSEDAKELSCPGSLKKGDIYTHSFHSFSSSIVDQATKKIDPGVWLAKKRGVIFDVGHGQGSFAWWVAESCAEQNFWPDVISTDLHSGNTMGPAYDLPIVMSKFYHIGMPILEVVKAVTATPAAAVGASDQIGSLSVGSCADITVLREKGVDLELEDTIGEVREVKKLLQPVAVWREGMTHTVTSPPEPFPNKAILADMMKYAHILANT